MYVQLYLFNQLIFSIFWSPQYQFVFDEAFHEHCTNEDVFARTAKPLIKTVFKRYMAYCSGPN